jgi:hypothetical protein
MIHHFAFRRRCVECLDFFNTNDERRVKCSDCLTFRHPGYGSPHSSPDDDPSWENARRLYEEES